MADFSISFNWMMLSEDGPAPYRYKQVEDYPPGSFAISGINSHVYPVQFARIALIPQDQRGPFIQNFYQIEFWNKWFAQLVSDEVAKRVFDESVNAGQGTAVKILQTALKTEVDELWGPNTVAAANAAQESSLVSSFIAARIQHYKDIAAENPAEARYLPQWIVRAEK